MSYSKNTIKLLNSEMAAASAASEATDLAVEALRSDGVTADMLRKDYDVEEGQTGNYQQCRNIAAKWFSAAHPDYKCEMLMVTDTTILNDAQKKQKAAIQTHQSHTVTRWRKALARDEISLLADDNREAQIPAIWEHKKAAKFIAEAEVFKNRKVDLLNNGYDIVAVQKLLKQVAQILLSAKAK